MDDPLYRDEILDHYDASPHRGRLDRPDRRAELENPLCGDTIRLELAIGADGRIDRVRFDGDGCVISQAAASLLAGHVEGRGAAEASRMGADEMLRLIGIALTPARLKCGLLAWRALRTALAEEVDAHGPVPADLSPLHP
jgi:nitrogen fixation NifU-like protein